MKMTKKKRSGKKKDEAYEGSRLTGSGMAGKAAKAIKKNKNTKRQRLGDIMSQIRSGRGQ